MEKFNKNLLNQMRIALIEDTDAKLTNSNLLKAMTINEELNHLGFTLKPLDVIRLAKSQNPENVLFDVKELYADKKRYKPMYPDFPKQVMEMDEAQFRFDQLVHYFSTYGIEELFGVEVSQGWMPKVEETEKTIEDDKLLKSKVLELANKQEALEKISKEILPKKERWIKEEVDLVKELAEENPDKVKGVTFKENIIQLYNVLDKQNANTKAIIKANCQHSGDVLKLADDVLNHAKLNSHGKKHLQTKDKRFFVNLLQEYPLKDFEENLALRRNRNVFLLRELSYSRFGKPEYLEVVNKLRNDDFKTFNSNLERKLRRHDKDALEFYSQRPGEMLRGCGRLLRLGYKEKDIINVLKGKELKAQTLLSNTVNFSNPKQNIKGDVNYGYAYRDEAEVKSLYKINRTLLKENMKKWDTPLKKADVYLEEGQYDFKHSFISTNDKNEEGGYIRSGLAYNFPKNIKTIRFFVFWNDDEKRVDLDLHAIGENKKKDDLYNVHIGWNGYFNINGVATSGDITTSRNSAEYIDIDLNKAKSLKNAQIWINSYNGIPFKNIQECYFGAMAVKEVGENVKQYNPKNLFFFNELKTSDLTLNYATINLEERNIRLLSKDETQKFFRRGEGYNIKEYLNDLFEAQKCRVYTDKKDKEFADVIVRLDKGESDKDFSLIDHNFCLPQGEDKVAKKEKNREDRLK